MAKSSVPDFDPNSYFDLPDPDALFPPVQVSIRDLESFRRNSVFRAFVRAMKVELLRLKSSTIRPGDRSIDEIRGRVYGVTYALTALQELYSPPSDKDSSKDDSTSDDMTIGDDINSIL